MWSYSFIITYHSIGPTFISFPQVHCPLPNGLNLNSVLTMYPLQSDTIRFLLLFLLVVPLRTAIAIDYECFEKRIKVVSGP